MTVLPITNANPAMDTLKINHVFALSGPGSDVSCCGGDNTFGCCGGDDNCGCGDNNCGCGDNNCSCCGGVYIIQRVR